MKINLTITYICRCNLTFKYKHSIYKLINIINIKSIIYYNTFDSRMSKAINAIYVYIVCVTKILKFSKINRNKKCILNGNS